jgi:hypothetical protein
MGRMDPEMILDSVREAYSEAARRPRGSPIVNGIFNLNPFRTQLFQELARVVKPGGSVWSAEIILNEQLPEAQRESEAAWFA